MAREHIPQKRIKAMAWKMPHEKPLVADTVHKMNHMEESFDELEVIERPIKRDLSHHTIVPIGNRMKTFVNPALP